MKTGKRNSTGGNRGNGEGKVNLCSLCSLLLKSERDGDADFVFLARDTDSPYIDKLKTREYLEQQFKVSFERFLAAK